MDSNERICSSQIDSRSFRDVLGHYASGITVICGRVDGKPYGFTCQSFYSVSISPPLISFSVSVASSTWPIIRPTNRFSINVLAHDQHDVAAAFGRSDIDRWAGIDWSETAAGNPLLAGALAWLDCDIHCIHLAGDHEIVVGKVKEIGMSNAATSGTPLLFFKGRYRHLKDIV